MAFFNWEDRFSVGIAEIDMQHQKLVQMLNELYDAMKAGKGNDVLGKVLNGMIQYTASHFATEERYMKLHGNSPWPGTADTLAAIARLDAADAINFAIDAVAIDLFRAVFAPHLDETEAADQLPHLILAWSAQQRNKNT